MPYRNYMYTLEMLSLRSIILRHLEYHAWASQKTFDSAAPLSVEALHRDLGHSHRSIFGTLLHTAQADAIWLKRLQGERDAKLTDFATDDFGELRVKSTGTLGKYLVFAGSLGDGDWNRIVDYRFMNGQEGHTAIYDNLLHVVNHGTYHRGQIAALLRQIGAEPIATDLVHYIRTLGTVVDGNRS